MTVIERLWLVVGPGGVGREQVYTYEGTAREHAEEIGGRVVEYVPATTPGAVEALRELHDAAKAARRQSWADAPTVARFLEAMTRASRTLGGQ